MSILRPYQNESVNQLSQAFKNHKRVIFVLPTGGGKTVCFSEIAFRASKRGSIVMVLTDRIELFDQTSKAILKHNIPICKIDAKNKILYKEAKLFVGMVETVARRLNKLSEINPSLIIIDEAHKGNFFKIIDAFPEAKVIGATATPVNKHLYKYYTNIVHVIDIPELVEQGFLCKCRPFEMQDNFDDVKIDRKGEFEDKSLFAHFDKPKLYNGVVDKYIETCYGKKTVVFNCNIAHSEEMTKRFNAAGIKSYSITSFTSDEERKWILSEFDKGSFPVLNNCGILTTGWDCPSVEVVIMNRATLSLSLFLQCCGRGSRKLLDENGKELLKKDGTPIKPYFMVLDFGMNHDRFGLWCEAREWHLKPPRKKKEDGVSPTKKCPECDYVMHAKIEQCPECGYMFPVKDKVLNEGTLVELTQSISNKIKGRRFSDLSIDEIIEIEKVVGPNGQKKYKASFIWRVIRSRGKESIYAYAKIKGFKEGWANRQIEDMEDSEYKDYIIK